jgi:hypothetical protein
MWFERHAPTDSVLVGATTNFPLRLSARYAAVYDPDYPGPPSLTEHAVYRHRLGAADPPRIEKALRGYGAPHTFLTLTASQGGTRDSTGCFVPDRSRASTAQCAPRPTSASSTGVGPRRSSCTGPGDSPARRRSDDWRRHKHEGSVRPPLEAGGADSDLGHGRFDVRRFRTGEAARARAGRLSSSFLRTGRGRPAADPPGCSFAARHAARRPGHRLARLRDRPRSPRRARPAEIRCRDRRACDGRLPRAHLARERGARRVAGGAALREGETGVQRARPIREHRHRHARTTRRPCRDARHRSRPRVPAVRDHRRRQREHD